MSFKYSADFSIEKFDYTLEGKPIFRKYVYKGQSGLNELKFAEILRQNPHANIVTIYDVRQPYIDMELLKTNLNYNQIKPFVNELKSVKSFLQSLGIAYLDWKLDNFGLSNEGDIKVFDFDMSCGFDKDVFTIIPESKCFLWKNAESKGLKTPTDIDNWIFNYTFGIM